MTRTGQVQLAAALIFLAVASGASEVQTQLNATWNLARLDQPGLPVGDTYTYAADGTGVTVYIISSGARSSHAEFASANSAAGSRLQAVATYTAKPGDEAGDDCGTFGGTHLGSVVGGRTYGVAKNVKMVSIKFAPCVGISQSGQLAAALDYVGAHAQHPSVVLVPALVPTSATTVINATQALLDKGITVIATAGALAADACSWVPANMPAVITVASLNSSDYLSDNTNWGSCVTLAAPGHDILGATGSASDSVVMSGPERAAAHVAGVAAQLLQYQPEASPAEVKQHIISTAAAGCIANLQGIPNLILQTDLSLGPIPSPSPAPASPLVDVAVSFDVAGIPAAALDGDAVRSILANLTSIPASAVTFVSATGSANSAVHIAAIVSSADPVGVQTALANAQNNGQLSGQVTSQLSAAYVANSLVVQPPSDPAPHKTLAAQPAFYGSFIALGGLALVAVAGGLIYRRHRQKRVHPRRKPASVVQQNARFDEPDAAARRLLQHDATLSTDSTKAASQAWGTAQPGNTGQPLHVQMAAVAGHSGAVNADQADSQLEAGRQPMSSSAHGSANASAFPVLVDHRSSADQSGAEGQQASQRFAPDPSLNPGGLSQQAVAVDGSSRQGSLEKRISQVDQLLQRNYEQLVSFESISASEVPGSGTQAVKRQLPDYCIQYATLKLGELIGRGGYGAVYQGTWQGTDVAIKMFNATELTKRVLKDLNREAFIMSTLRHPNVVTFYGMVLQRHRQALVMQYCDQGSLYQLLHCDSMELPWRRRVQMALNIAAGMEYLHSRQPPYGPVIHGDLKSKNLLMDRNFQVLICDFGMSVMKTETRTVNNIVPETDGLTVAWTAPEVLNQLEAQPFSRSKTSDVYSVGMVLYEIVTRLLPFQGVPESLMVHHITQGRRPELPADCPSDMAELIRSCWAQDPAQRPSMTGVVDWLAEMLRALPSDKRK